MRRVAGFLAALMALTWAAGAAAATAGVFQFVAGDVRIVSGAGERQARKGVLLSVGEEIATAENSSAQIKMGDGGIVVVQPRSRMTVAVFNYSGVEDGSERVVFRLEQGGFRSVTGAIGNTHKNSYRIETPIAHMGVRGTDHESYYFPPGGNEIPGAYNKVNTGLTFIRTAAGEVLVAPNQVGYVRGAQDAPGLLPTIPGFFNRAVAPRTARLPSPDVVPPKPQVLQVVATVGGANLSGGGTVPAAQGTGSVTGYITQKGNSGTFDGMSAVNGVVVPGGATFANAGSDTVWGVNWGTWQGGAPTVDGNAAIGAVHVMQSTNLTTADQLATLAASAVNATYATYLGGPAPTNQAGVQGKINSMSVGVNFGTQTVTYAVNATVDSKTWDVPKSIGSVAQFTSASGIQISGTCTGCNGNPNASTAASGTANGAFVGPAAERLITSFGLKSAAQTAISGTAYLGR